MATSGQQLQTPYLVWGKCRGFSPNTTEARIHARHDLKPLATAAKLSCHDSQGLTTASRLPPRADPAQGRTRWQPIKLSLTRQLAPNKYAHATPGAERDVRWAPQGVYEMSVSMLWSPTQGV